MCDSLGRDGIVQTLLVAIRNLKDKKYCPKLKASLEALMIVTKTGESSGNFTLVPFTRLDLISEGNLKRLVQGNCVRALLDILSRYSLFLLAPRLASKIVSAVMAIFFRLVSTGESLPYRL